MEDKLPKISRWVCTPHALQRILERKISAEELAQVVESPDFRIPQGPKWIFAKTIVGPSQSNFEFRRREFDSEQPRPFFESQLHRRIQVAGQSAVFVRQNTPPAVLEFSLERGVYQLVCQPTQIESSFLSPKE